MFVFNVSSLQLNQMHRAASQSPTTQVNTTSPGETPMRKLVSTPICSTTSSISSITTKEETNT